MTIEIGRDGFYLTCPDRIDRINRLVDTADLVKKQIEGRLHCPIIDSPHAKPISDGLTSLGHWTFVRPVWNNDLSLSIMETDVSSMVLAMVKGAFQVDIAFNLYHPDDYLESMEDHGEWPIISDEKWENMDDKQQEQEMIAMESKATCLGLRNGFYTFEGHVRGFHDTLRFYIMVPTVPVNPRNAQLQLDYLRLEFDHFNKEEVQLNASSDKNILLSMVAWDLENNLRLAQWLLEGLLESARIEPDTGDFPFLSPFGNIS